MPAWPPWCSSAHWQAQGWVAPWLPRLYQARQGQLSPSVDSQERWVATPRMSALCRQLLDAAGSEAAVDPALLEPLAHYPWPGNGRQLANALRAASVQLEPHERMIRLEHLPDDLREELATLAQQPMQDLKGIKGGLGGPGRAERALPDAAEVARTVAACEGNLSEAARRLGISRNTLYRRLREAGEDTAADDSASR